jgi:hypothetical protein
MPAVPINSIYLSSTFQDLELFRDTVGRYLRKINKQVIGMEDYVAADVRPLDKCLQDVARADAYVGIFAHRYGFIPGADNSELRSITELEYRHALTCKKPCLIFVLSEEVPWPRKFMDEITREGENGKRIFDLRGELTKDNLASFFKNEVELAALVNAAVTNLESTKPALPAASAGGRATPENREITSDLFVAYGPADEATTKALATEFLPDPGGLSSLLSPTGLFASSEAAFVELDLRIQTSDIAVAVLSKQTLSQMDQQPVFTSLVLDILRARTGTLVGLYTTQDCVEAARKWGFENLIDISGYPAAGVALIQDLKQKLGDHRTVASVPVIGVPLVIAAMTKDEAEALCNHPEMIADELGTKAQKRFEEIRAALLERLPSRYGSARDQWRSPGSKLTMAELSVEALQRLARVKKSKLRGRAMKLQKYPFDPLVEKVEALREVYRQMADTGCIMLVDELSLFHPVVRQAVASSPMVGSRHTAILTVSPFQAQAQPQEQILREELKAQLAGVFDRFASDYDPQCELSVGDEFRLRRWLHVSLPETLLILRTPRVEPAQVAIFASELQSDADSQTAGLMYSRGLL